ncbi:MAG: bacteriocin-protection protein [Burkholderiales bacterium]|nr:MAG: bacteriocin-protection protein [Burkholderiales bacterium]
MKPADVLYFDSAEQLRDWLLAHHATSPPAWIAIAKRGCAHHVLPYRDALDAALCFGWIDGVVGRLDDDHYALRLSRRRPGSNWSAVNVRRFAELQADGWLHPSGLAAFEQRDRAVSEDTPAVLAEADLAAFVANPAAWAFFETQPAGYRRQASWYVLSARTEPTRQRRLSRLIELSASGLRLPGY